MQFGISITICTYNGKQRIQKAIASIANQKLYNPEYVELIIVDNASIDGTVEYCEMILKAINLKMRYRILLEPKAGAVNARYKALQAAQYNWLLICDDDNELDENYISNAISILSTNAKIGALGGKGIAVFEIAKPNWFDKYCSSYAVEKQNDTNGKIKKYNAALYGAGTFFNVSALKKIYASGFNTVMIGPNKKALTRGEDTEWCYLLLLQNLEMWYSGNLLFKHYLNKERITWAYYLELKKGIANGAALLFSYHYILQNNNISSVFYFVKYLKQTLLHTLLYIKYFGYKVISNANEKQLAFVIAQSKMKSFYYNFFASYQSFKRIKKMVEINTSNVTI